MQGQSFGHPSLTSSHTAIMRGAVLHQLGMKVDERVMRRHYGVRMKREFEAGDPSRFKVIGNDGVEMCDDVMKWYVNKVCQSFRFSECVE